MNATLLATESIKADPRYAGYAGLPADTYFTPEAWDVATSWARRTDEREGVHIWEATDRVWDALLVAGATAKAAPGDRVPFVLTPNVDRVRLVADFREAGRVTIKIPGQR